MTVILIRWFNPTPLPTKIRKRRNPMNAIPANYKGAAKPLLPTDIRDEAASLQCKTAIIHAFSDLESGGASGYQSDADCPRQSHGLEE